MLVSLIPLLLMLLVVGVLLTVVTVRQFNSDANKAVKELTPAAALKRIRTKGQDACIPLDIRQPREYERGHIPGARNMSVMDLHFIRQLKSLSKQQTYLVYSTSTSRALRAIAKMKGRGFKQVYILKGGFLQWQMDELPEEK